MLRRVTTSAPIPPLLGYADHFSVAPGETIRFMVSADVPRYRASLVRLIQGDESPAGPGYQEEVMESTIAREYAGRRQSLVAGSYVRVAASPLFDLADGFTVQVWLWPTTSNKPGGQGLVSRWRGFALNLDADDRLDLWLAFADGTTERIIQPGPSVARRRWTLVSASYDATTGLVRLLRRGVDAPRGQPYHGPVDPGITPATG
jgi:N,N-dimethylformamidase